MRCASNPSSSSCPDLFGHPCRPCGGSGGRDARNKFRASTEGAHSGTVESEGTGDKLRASGSTRISARYPNPTPRHARTCSGHPCGRDGRAGGGRRWKWMPGTSPGMTDGGVSAVTEGAHSGNRWFCEGTGDVARPDRDTDQRRGIPTHSSSCPGLVPGIHAAVAAEVGGRGCRGDKSGHDGGAFGFVTEGAHPLTAESKGTGGRCARPDRDTDRRPSIPTLPSRRCLSSIIDPDLFRASMRPCGGSGGSGCPEQVRALTDGAFRP